MFYVYVLRSEKDGQLYIGFTTDLRRRVREHFSGESFATKGRLPFEIILYEAYQNETDARARERFLKTGWGRNYLKRVLKHYFVGLQKVGRGL
ncbi:MAG: excinuclease ABC subunit C [Candidatus Taylorbacteria bacterium CG11_big_fil_rev_8_21_14_0_20_46_11]|uniref:Excinuclease ABC subunit C n=1 Tax=Candidatus Taylorbacteria bacterium CG11_big_fil_rev_8_21_14_0_20_46_11 TaxID=1975025 RepID=A0A2H0KD95_9BACT|nr:MAG: excinuclease ABC subunit C [Candidatus Taylorbacteria bacterium CG11_big_fil_rev_8_21_14_0_20_46_11]